MPAPELGSGYASTCVHYSSRRSGWRGRGPGWPPTAIELMGSPRSRGLDRVAREREMTRSAYIRVLPSADVSRWQPQEQAVPVGRLLGGGEFADVAAPCQISCFFFVRAATN
jgi:hypothetical protein